MVVGVVSNTITDNTGTGFQLNLNSGGVSASGITGNVIRRQDVGMRIAGGGPPVVTLSGNDIYQNTSFELRNESGTAVLANGNYWGSPTTSELAASSANLSRIYDIRDGASQQVLISQWYAGSLSGGSPGPLQSFDYSVPGATQVVSGSVNGSQTWTGKIVVVGDVTVTGNLTIAAGTEVIFDALHDTQASGSDRSRCELILNGGSLLVNGTSGNPVKLTSGGVNKNAGDWYGIRLVEGDVTLSHCVVEYAVDGLRFEDADTRFNSYALGNVTVQRCTGNGVFVNSGGFVMPVVLSNFQLLTNATGLSAQGPAEVRGGRAEGNSSYGLYASSTSLTVTGMVVRLNGSYGINCDRGTLMLTDCAVTYNSGYGVYGFGTALQMSGCTVSRNNNWGVMWSSFNFYGQRTAEVSNCLIQSNASGGLTLGDYMVVGVVSNTITDNTGTGFQLNLNSGGVSASGITGNVIRRQDVGMRIAGGGPPVVTLSGNDIYQNTSFELRNESSSPITATNGYWGEPTSTELNQNQVNLSRIYDQRDNGSYGLVTIQNPRFSPIGGGGGGTPPTITLHPQPQTVVVGTPASFTVAASGPTPFSYHWRKNNNPISGATNVSLVLLNVQAGDVGTYSVVVSNSAGTATSSGALLTVNPAPNNLATRTITPNGLSFFVSMTVSPWSGLGWGFVEETIPTGFIATGLNAGGTFNASTGKILWGPMADNQTYQLSYTLQPPVAFQGTRQLTGTAYFGSAGTLVTGDTTVSLLPSGQPATLGLSKTFGFWTVSITGELGRSYQLEARDNLNSGQWQPLATLNITANPRLYIDGDAVGKPQRFYRAVLVE
jgi:hypothetical protein